MDPARNNSNDTHLGRSPFHDNGTNKPKDSPTKSHHVKPTDPSPLKDITNSTLAQLPLILASDRRWVRMQRPTPILDETNLEFSLGKRGPLPTLENSNSQKRRAALGDDSSPPSPQMAIAGKQPRRP